MIPPRSLMVEKHNIAPSIPYLPRGLLAFSTHPWTPMCCIKVISLTSLSGEELKCDLNDQKSNKINNLSRTTRESPTGLQQLP